MYVKIYSYESRFCLLTILMDSQVSKSLKQQFLILLLCRPALHLSQFNSIFNLSVLYWHDKNYTFVLPKQLQLGCSQIVHILYVLTERKRIIIVIIIIIYKSIKQVVQNELLMYASI